MLPNHAIRPSRIRRGGLTRSAARQAVSSGNFSFSGCAAHIQFSAHPAAPARGIGPVALKNCGRSCTLVASSGGLSSEPALRSGL